MVDGRVIAATVTASVMVLVAIIIAIIMILKSNRTTPSMATPQLLFLELAPSIPQNPRIVATNETDVTLQWQIRSDERFAYEQNYMVEYFDKYSGPKKIIDSGQSKPKTAKTTAFRKIDAITRAITVTGLEPGDPYLFQIRQMSGLHASEPARLRSWTRTKRRPKNYRPS